MNAHQVIGWLLINCGNNRSVYIFVKMHDLAGVVEGRESGFLLRNWEQLRHTICPFEEPIDTMHNAQFIGRGDSDYRIVVSWVLFTVTIILVCGIISSPYNLPHLKIQKRCFI